MSPSTDAPFRRWTLGLLTAILLMLGGFWSIGAVKSYAAGARLDDQDRRLQRIEEKLDRLLEHQRGGRNDR